jgi:hypothetical protein
MKPPIKKYINDSQLQQIFEEIDNFEVPLSSKNYDENLIRGYDRIIIIGSQRSGTTFVSQAISNTLGFRNVDENEFNVKDVNKFKNIFKQKNIVVQAPGLTHLIQNLVSENDLVIFMTRKWSDIIKSVFRKNGKLSNWILMNDMYDVNKYYYSTGYFKDLHGKVHELYDKKDEKCESVFKEVVDKNSYYLDVVYKMWKYYQRDLIPNYIELDYESMKLHPMWVNKQNREDFSPKQTKINKK